jgi:DNA polymerase-3 subunit alpha
MKSNIFKICEEKLKEKGLYEDKRYQKRLEWEKQEIISQNKENYFLDMVTRNVNYPDNENNLLVCWLLEIVPNFDIEKDPNYVQGDSPDIDVDFIPAVRDFLKNEWAPKTFGEQYVCNIGNYTTFGIKSSLIDMVRVHGEERGEILALTTNLQTKDDEGKVLTWDSAMKTDPMLKKYCEEHPDIAKAAQKLINRNRGTGIHAGGLIVSSIPLTDLVPLIKRKDSPQASAWVEGLHGQDLQPVGLVKFDVRVISNLLQIAKCCKLIKDRKGIDKICAFPGQGNWSNIDEYRNDLKSLEMANEGDLKCIFQFDSPGIRSLAKAGGVTRFEDLVAYSSLYRPGPLNCLQKDVKVNTNLGYKKIKDLKPGLDKIAYLSKKKKIKYTEKFILIKTGYKKLLKIKTKSGKVILCSNEHKILTDKDEFIEAEKLSVGQKIAKKLK